jgi:hypothetical protein
MRMVSQASDNREVMTIQKDAQTACVELRKNYGFDIVVAIRMPSCDALMFPNTAENSERCHCILLAERWRPRISAANAASMADNLPQQQQKQ